MSYMNTLLSPNVKVATLESTSTKGDDYRTDFEQLLEFHDEMYLNDFKNGNLYYKSLLESNVVLNEGVFTSMSAIIAGIVLAITTMFAMIFKGGSGSGGSGGSSSSNSAVNKVKEVIKKNGDTAKKLNQTLEEKYRDNKIDRNETFAVHKYSFGVFTNTVPDFNNIFEDQDLSNDIDKLYSEFEVEFAGAVGNKDDNDDNTFESIMGKIDGLKERLTKYEIKNNSIFNPEVIDMTVDDIMPLSRNSAFFTTYENKYKNYQPSRIAILSKGLDMLDKMKNEIDEAIKSADLPDEEMKEINEGITALKNLRALILLYMQKLKDYKSCVDNAIALQSLEINKAMTHFIKQSMDNATKNLAKEIGQTDSYGESANLTDFEIDCLRVQEEAADLDNQFSNVLAATMKDLKWEYMDAYRQGYVNEAVIRAKGENVEKQMIELNEAIGAKVKSAFNNAVAKIKELFAKFMEKLRANVTSTKNYLDKYKKFILGTKINQDYTGKDIINGMYRVMNYTIPAFDYNSIKDSLADPQTFFDQQLKPKTDDPKVRNGKQPTVNIDGTDQSLSQIGEWFKQWFGCAGDDGDILASDLQNSIKDIYDFMYDTSKIEKSINDSIKNVERLRDRALKQAGVPVVPNQEGYTYLGHTPALLLEMTPKQNNTAQSTANQTGAPANNYTGNVSSQMTNVAQTQNKDANGQEQYGVDQTAKEEVDAKCNVYIQTVTKVLQAKLTAVEFLRNEFMVVFRDLVKRNVEGNADPSGDSNNNTYRMPNYQVQNKHFTGKASQKQVDAANAIRNKGK